MAPPREGFRLFDWPRTCPKKVFAARGGVSGCARSSCSAPDSNRAEALKRFPQKQSELLRVKVALRYAGCSVTRDARSNVHRTGVSTLHNAVYVTSHHCLDVETTLPPAMHCEHFAPLSDSAHTLSARPFNYTARRLLSRRRSDDLQCWRVCFGRSRASRASSLEANLPPRHGPRRPRPCFQVAKQYLT